MNVTMMTVHSGSYSRTLVLEKRSSSGSQAAYGISCSAALNEWWLLYIQLENEAHGDTEKQGCDMRPKGTEREK